MRRAYDLRIQVRLTGQTRSGGGVGMGLMEATVPAPTFEDALSVLTDFLRTQEMDLADVLACEGFDLDKWDHKEYPLDSPTWRHIQHVVNHNCIWASDVAPLRSSEPAPARRARFFLVKATILKDVVPSAKGKTAYVMYALPPRTLDEALGELRRDLEEDDMRMEEIIRMVLLDDRRAIRDRKGHRALRKAVANGEVWRGPVIFGP